MELIAFTDIHSYHSDLEKISPLLKGADAVIIAGDITDFGYGEESGQILDELSHYNSKIFAVAGNCDNPDVEEFLNTKGWNVNKSVKNFNGYSITGFSGSLPCPGKTPNEYSETDYKNEILRIKNDLNPESQTILITHQPPYNTLNDQVSPGMHVGSHSIRSFIEELQPLICFTGHIHEGVGIDDIGNSKIVNPGPMKYGRYAYAKLIDGQIIELSIKNI